MARRSPVRESSRVPAGVRRAAVPAALTLLVVAAGVVAVVSLRQPDPVSDGLPADAGANVRPTPEVAGVPAAAGVHVSATVNADGSLDVVERLLLTEPKLVVVLAVPSPPEAVSDPATAATAASPEAHDLLLTADGKNAPAPRTVTTQATTVPLSTRATALTVRYRLVGATVRSTPSAPGRALTSLASIASPTETGLPLTLSLSPHGSTILNVTCPGLAPAGAATCATENGGRWRTTAPLRATEGYALAQLDLAR
jgi:hypothetical protein